MTTLSTQQANKYDVTDKLSRHKFDVKGPFDESREEDRIKKKSEKRIKTESRERRVKKRHKERRGSEFNCFISL